MVSNSGGQDQRRSQIPMGRNPQRLPDRIRAHALICFIALVLHRVMRMRLRATASKVSPERADRKSVV